MTTFTVTQHARAPVARVFELAADLRRAPERIPAIQKLEVLTDGPIRVGTRFRETRVVFGRAHTEEMEVVGFDPPRSYTLRATSCGCRYDTRLEFVPSGDGTDVSFHFQATPLNFFAKVMGVLMRSMTKKMVALCAKDLEAIAAAAERG
jgi:carbon monoxide dehydrogenase subunit G